MGLGSRKLIFLHNLGEYHPLKVKYSFILISAAMSFQAYNSLISASSHRLWENISLSFMSYVYNTLNTAQLSNISNDKKKRIIYTLVFSSLKELVC